MKLQQLVEEQGGYPLFVSTIKKLKINDAMKYLKKVNLPAFETGVRAAKAGVPRGYWNYSAQAGSAAKVGGDLHNLAWAITKMKSFQTEDAFVNELGKKLIPVVSDMEEASSYFKGIDAFYMAAQAVANYANTAADSLNRSLARATMKKLGLAEYFGVKDAA